jgi:hypothetical protein
MGASAVGFVRAPGHARQSSGRRGHMPSEGRCAWHMHALEGARRSHSLECNHECDQVDKQFMPNSHQSILACSSTLNDAPSPLFRESWIDSGRRMLRHPADDAGPRIKDFATPAAHEPPDRKSG